MDFTDPQTMVSLLATVLGPTLAKWAVAAMIWMNAARLVFKPLQARIQASADAFSAWLDQSGNTDIRARVACHVKSPAVRFSFWLLDYLFSIKLGSQRATKTVTTTETATVITKTEVPAPIATEQSVMEKTTETSSVTTKTETPVPPAS